MDQELRKFMKEQGGVVSVSELADVLDLDEGQVRRWARENEVKRVGATFAFDKDAAFRCADDLLGADEDEDDVDEGESDDGDDEEREESSDEDDETDDDEND